MLRIQIELETEAFPCLEIRAKGEQLESILTAEVIHTSGKKQKAYEIEYLIPPLPDFFHCKLEIIVDGTIIYTLASIPEIEMPAYHHLFHVKQIFKRHDIYGSGLPVHEVSEPVLKITKSLPTPLLDFGCGIGTLIKKLNYKEREIRGIELDRPEVRDNLQPAVADRITLYDGALPLPYEDNIFRSVIAIEVLEHIDQFEEILQELIRITSDELFLTVPDISAIPLCHRHQIIPWHLLEATHVNFFNHNTLKHHLTPWFHHLQFYRVGAIEIEGQLHYTSIGVRCSRKKGH